jgi:hypothetical protein
MDASRRCTSAAAWAASITHAAPSAMSENAPSSAITTPAAPSMRTRTPERVMKRRSSTPAVVARACCSVTSVRSGSAVQISAWLTCQPRMPRSCSQARLT